MALDLAPFAADGLDQGTLESLLGEHDTHVRPNLERLWSYYRNSQTPGYPAVWNAAGAGQGQGRPYRLAQEAGLPDRLTNPPAGAPTRHTVIENDIAWRIDALVDLAFGPAPTIASADTDESRRAAIDAALAATWDASGGHQLIQDIALLGMVHGYVDLVLRTSDLPRYERDPVAAAAHLRVDIVEAPRAVPVIDPADYRRLTAFIIRGRAASTASRRDSALDRVIQRVRGGLSREPDQHETLEVISAEHRRVFIAGKRVLDEPQNLAELPVVHIQNASQPFRYEGLSDVEPLIPLQDELNTRLSDRAHRVTLQSFNMYLAKGLDALSPAANPAGALRVGPGQVWLTDNPDADVKAFGGDGHSPSEDRHIDELRDALDKASAVSPVVIGVIRERLGHLSSENALRLTLMGVLSKVARRRLAYARGLERMSRLILAALDHAGALKTTPAQRAVRVTWPDPIPTDERSRLTAALMKRDLGVPLDQLRRELGYAD